MLKKLTVAVTALVLVTPGAPIAHAAVIRAQCMLAAASTWRPQATGGLGTFNGAAIGYALFDDLAAHTLRCEVRVNGTSESSSIEESGSGLVSSSGPVTFFADDAALVELCTVIDNVDYSCAEVINQPFLPQEMVDALDSVLDLLGEAQAGVVDPLVCPALALLSPGVPGLVEIASDGDVSLTGEDILWDCPPWGYSVGLFPHGRLVMVFPW